MHPIILWDFDGTLYNSVDSYVFYASAVNDLSKANNNTFLNLCKDSIYGRGSYVGEDGWAIVARIAREMHLDEFLDKAFERTRESMNRGEISINRTESALNILSRTDCEHTLLTNTPEKYARPILVDLEFIDYFQAIYYGAKKPEGLEKLGTKIVDESGVDPKNVLSIGDNYVNDIRVAQKLGFTTLYIDNYGSGFKGTHTVKKFEEGVPFILEFLNSRN